MQLKGRYHGRYTVHSMSSTVVHSPKNGKIKVASTYIHTITLIGTNITHQQGFVSLVAKQSAGNLFTALACERADSFKFFSSYGVVDGGG